MNEPESIGPVIRIAPLGELNPWIVYEHELDSLAIGSPGAVSFSFAMALLPVSLTLFVTLVTVDIPSIRLFTVFVCGCFVSFGLGTICLVHWLRSRYSAGNIVQRIKDRKLPEGIQELAPRSHS